MAEMIQPRTPPGTMELLPNEQIAFQRMLDTIRSGYERFGFVPIETPVFELTDVLLTKEGGETEKQVYFAQSTGARQQELEAIRKGAGPASGVQLATPELALRFDLTVPLARYVAQHEPELVFPFRRYQMQRVYRGERNQRGRYREFYQCDVDVIGKDTLPLTFDAEMPAVIFHVFTALNVGPFTIRLNNRKLLTGMLASLGIVEPAKAGAVLREVDKLDKIGIEKVTQALAAPEIGLSADSAKRVLDFVAIRGTNDEVVKSLEGLSITEPTFALGLSELKTVLAALPVQGVPNERVRIDVSIARGLDYYTGTIYETVLDEHPGVGSVCSGGRYDNLASHYTKSKLPGVGLSIGATRLFFQLKEAGIIKAASSTCTAFVAQMDSALEADCRALATELRQAGINTELSAEASKMAKQFKYADRAAIPFVLVLGEKEKAAGTVAVKDMRSQQQADVPRAELAAYLRARQ